MPMMSRLGSCLGSNRATLFCLAVMLALVGCQPLEGAPAKTTVIRIAGASAMQPVLYDLTTAFTHQHPTVFFELAGGDSTIGEERLFAAQIDLAASTLISPTTPVVLVQGRRERTVSRTPIGLDGLALVVHASNAITNLTTVQVQALYSGRLLTWAEVGGPPDDVLLLSREDGSGSRQLFEERLMGEERVSLTAVVMPTNADIVAYVAKHPNAIGYVSRAYVVAVIDQATQPNLLPVEAQAPTPAAPLVKVVALDGQLPTQQAIQTQSYPLIQPLYLVGRTRPAGWLQQFIDFTLSPAGQTIVARYHARVR